MPVSLFSPVRYICIFASIVGAFITVILRQAEKNSRASIFDTFDENLAIAGSARSIICLTTGISSEMRTLGSAATIVPGQQEISGVNSIHSPRTSPAHISLTKIWCPCAVFS